VILLSLSKDYSFEDHLKKFNRDGDNMKVLVPLAAGFEEIEAVTIIDVLRRAQLEVVVCALDGLKVIGSHDIELQAEQLIDSLEADVFQAIVLPGGIPGALNLRDNQRVLDFIKTIYNNEGYAAAICAAPIVLAEAGILKDKNVTCYPNRVKELKGANHVPKPCVVDGRIITGQGAGAALEFSLQLVEILKNKKLAEELREKMLA
jgi:4-methyl-5(b-hydroxyethyl)-thiazole monophosphate biosynthesis